MRRLRPLLALVPLLGLLELGLHQYFAARAPGFPAYEALGTELLRRKQPGVPVVVSPAWAEPLVRQAAPAAFPVSELARPDDRRFARFLEVSVLGERAAELSDFPIREQQQHGAFNLLLRDSPRFEEPHYDFVSAVETGAAEVWHEVAGERSRCSRVDRQRATTGGLHGPVARPTRGFECSGGRFVGVTLIEDQQYRPRRCILVDPVRAGHVVLRFAAVPASPRLVGFTGFPYFLSRDVRGKPVELAISESGAELVRQGSEPRHGWQRFDVRRPEPGGGIEVVVVRHENEPGDFCFALEAR
jgi:hypothetical protein